MNWLCPTSFAIVEKDLFIRNYLIKFQSSKISINFAHWIKTQTRSWEGEIAAHKTLL